VIRVLYRWRVEEGRRESFTSWWHEGTLRIRSSQPGSFGSTLCRAGDDPAVFVGIARWAGRDALEAFWKQAAGDPFEGAVLETVEVLEELDDLTLGVEEPAP
jgi:heme-degrading monooxygenase HmoA